MIQGSRQNYKSPNNDALLSQITSNAQFLQHDRLRLSSLVFYSLLGCARVFRCGPREHWPGAYIFSKHSPRTIDTLQRSHKEPHTLCQGNKESFETQRQGKVCNTRTLRRDFCSLQTQMFITGEERVMTLLLWILSVRNVHFTETTRLLIHDVFLSFLMLTKSVLIVEVSGSCSFFCLQKHRTIKLPLFEIMFYL